MSKLKNTNAKRNKSASVKTVNVNESNETHTEIVVCQADLEFLKCCVAPNQNEQIKLKLKSTYKYRQEYYKTNYKIIDDYRFFLLSVELVKTYLNYHVLILIYYKIIHQIFFLDTFRVWFISSYRRI